MKSLCAGELGMLAMESLYAGELDKLRTLESLLAAKLGKLRTEDSLLKIKYAVG
jgi:hypothetical protein